MHTFTHVLRCLPELVLLIGLTRPCSAHRLSRPLLLVGLLGYKSMFPVILLEFYCPF